MEKRFEAIDNDYLSIPDAGDFGFRGQSIVFAVEFDNRDGHCIIQTLRNEQEFELYLRS